MIHDRVCSTIGCNGRPLNVDLSDDLSDPLHTGEDGHRHAAVGERWAQRGAVNGIERR